MFIISRVVCIGPEKPRWGVVSYVYIYTFTHGYIPKEKLRKVAVAIRNSEIQKVEFKFIGVMFVPDLNDWLYHPRVLISKVGH